MSLVQFGTNIASIRKKAVAFYNRDDTSKTVYEGMPVCYMFDTDNNVLGLNKETNVKGTTTADGYQNEGRFLITELPYSDNQQWFAGVVAAGPWCNKSVATLATKWLDIYEPNGAIVPVRVDISTTVGRTILCIETDSQELTQTSGTAWSRPVAIAEETVTSTGLCLAKLDPNLFISQCNYGAALIVAPDGAGGVALNRINVTEGYTSGSFCAFEIKSEHTGGSESSYGLAFMARAVVSAAVGAESCAVGIRLNITGGIQTAVPLSALRIQLTESAGATVDPVASGSVGFSVLNLVNQFAENPTANKHQWIYLENNGSYPPDNLFFAKLASEIPLTAHVTDAFSHSIAIRVTGKSYYIMCTETSTNKS